MPRATTPKNPRFEVYLGVANVMNPDTPGAGRARFEPRQSWHWRLYARNGEIVASGEGHGSDKDARRACKAVIRAVLAIEAREREARLPKKRLVPTVRRATEAAKTAGEGVRPRGRRARVQ